MFSATIPAATMLATTVVILPVDERAHQVLGAP